MKIIKIRRGFTTNSSSSNEWVFEPSTLNETGSNISQQNAIKIGGLTLFVLILIFFDRVIRKWIKKNLPLNNSKLNFKKAKTKVNPNSNPE